MVVHVFANVSEEKCRDDRDRPERNAREVYVLVCLCECNFTSFDDGFVQDIVSRDTWDLLDVVQQGGSRQLDDLLDGLRRCDPSGVQGSTNVVDGGWGELVDEYVV